MKNSESINIEFKNLIAKFQSGNCSVAELHQLQDIFLDTSVSEKIKNSMLDEIPYFETSGSEFDTDYDRLFKSIQKVISSKKENKRIINLRFNLLRIAAVLVIAFVLGGTISYFLFSTELKASKSFCRIIHMYGSMQVVK